MEKNGHFMLYLFKQFKNSTCPICFGIAKKKILDKEHPIDMKKADF